MDRRTRLVNLIPLVWNNIHRADVFSERGHDLMARALRWMRRNGLTAPFEG